jgi:hypothetical protein
MVKAQEYVMKNFLFNESQKRAFEETQVNMGASIENNHLLAALTEKTKQSGKCEIV